MSDRFPVIPSRFVLALAVCAGVLAPIASPFAATGALAQELPPVDERRTDASAESPPFSRGSVDLDDLMADGPLPDIVIGDPDAPVTIVEYASLTCPHCASFHNGALPDLKADYIDTGIAKLVIREFPFDPQGLAGFMLGRCVAPQQRGPLIEHLFRDGSWSRAESVSASLLAIARQTGMSRDDFVACIQNVELQGQVLAVKDRGEREFAVQATPTFFINGSRYSGAMSANQMAALIEDHR